ncbi:MAG: bifunctional UDP-N-acetylglucosamine diphosphorylase/glucosamine-1-phosphate N-acetyltransferase GlmU [Thermomicrobiales bacterium]|nr:bifunctional UDP-N-acetylglucosamine diphosphorylase/glucosamine-1-phosphate N-acetyltransferase GlmU [Thermomicrobiales bacterium]
MTFPAIPATLSIVVLAAGAGSRMKSSLPKPLHAAAGKPMLAHVLSAARSLAPADITVVGSPGIASHLATADWMDGVTLAIQDPPLGTADAVRTGLGAHQSGEIVLVLYADHPLVTGEILAGLLSEIDWTTHRLAVLTCNVDDAAGYGRIDRDDERRVRAIVEKVADEPSMRRGVTEINSGVMVLNRRWAVDALARLAPNSQKGEYFLTDLVALAYDENPNSVAGIAGPRDVLIGVNDRIELAVADAHLRQRKRLQLQRDGVTLIDPTSNLIDLDVQIGPDTTVGPGCVLEGATRIGEGCRIGPYAVVRSSTVADEVRIESSTIEDSTIDSNSDVGPYSHLRGHTNIGKGVHIGNFAELKNATLGDAVRVGHFSYLGDASVGAEVNIGAGSITCNYDGAGKHRPRSAPGRSLGDTMLIAPISVGAGARTGAGAVVTRNVADGATVVGMPARQIRRKREDDSDAADGGEQ